MRAAVSARLRTVGLRPRLRLRAPSGRAVSTSASDFDHHHPRIARLNHGSFGACPRPVLEAQDAFRKEWLAHPDGLYFTGRIHDGIEEAGAAAATALSPQPVDAASQIAIVENATVAANAIARRWAKRIRKGDVVVHLSYAYKACIHVLREHCEREGATLVELEVPWLCATEAEICDAVDAQLGKLAREHPELQLRYAFLDHVSSQPAVLLPVKRLVALCRQHGAEEVCGRCHAVGSVPDLDVVDIDADFLHELYKGFCTQHCVGAAPAGPNLMHTTGHPITSWDWKEGLSREAGAGHRDFSAIMALPAAVNIADWRSPVSGGEESMTSAQYCHAACRGCCTASLCVGH